MPAARHRSAGQGRGRARRASRIEELAAVAFGGHFAARPNSCRARVAARGSIAAVHMTRGRHRHAAPRLRAAVRCRWRDGSRRMSPSRGEAATLNAATRQARISAVVTMTGGTIAREVIEMASTDVRALFRTSRGTTHVSLPAGGGRHPRRATGRRRRCVSAPAPAPSAGSRPSTSIGTGSTSSSAASSDTTDFFALDVPVRVSGSFADPDIAPAQWSREARARMTRNEMAPLPPDLRDIARRNPCYRGRSLRR